MVNLQLIWYSIKIVLDEYAILEKHQQFFKHSHIFLVII